MPIDAVHNILRQSDDQIVSSYGSRSGLKQRHPNRFLYDPAGTAGRDRLGSFPTYMKDIAREPGQSFSSDAHGRQWRINVIQDSGSGLLIKRGVDGGHDEVVGFFRRIGGAMMPDSVARYASEDQYAYELRSALRSYPADAAAAKSSRRGNPLYRNVLGEGGPEAYERIANTVDDTVLTYGQKALNRPSGGRSMGTTFRSIGGTRASITLLASLIKESKLSAIVHQNANR